MTKTVMVTGATSGFGLATVKRFLQDDWRVIATGRRADRLQAIVEEHGADRVWPSAFDIRNEEAVDAALAALPGAFGVIDVLVNNAGLARGLAPAQKASLDDWRTMIDTNITGLVTITHRLLPRLIERKAAIINVGSIAGTYPYPGANAYGGTKAFVRQFSLALRSDLHGTGVRVTDVEPGMAQTEFMLVRTGGDKAASDALYAGAHPLTGPDVADVIYWAATQPPHVNINRVEVMPVSQSWPAFQIHREVKST
jgi:serine 3-dehydrogenase (NADP+)